MRLTVESRSQQTVGDHECRLAEGRRTVVEEAAHADALLLAQAQHLVPFRLVVPALVLRPLPTRRVARPTRDQVPDADEVEQLLQPRLDGRGAV